MDTDKPKSACRHYDYCGAPFCPLEEIPADRTWFIDEEICRVNEPPYWVLRQKKLKLRTKDNTTCYTFNMVKWKCMIKKNIEGIKPSNTLSQQKKREKAWMKNHKLKKPLSVKEREERRRRLEKARLVKKNMYDSRIENIPL